MNNEVKIIGMQKTPCHLQFIPLNTKSGKRISFKSSFDCKFLKITEKIFDLNRKLKKENKILVRRF